MTLLFTLDGRPVGLAPESTLIAAGERAYVHSTDGVSYIRVKARPALDDWSRWEPGYVTRRAAVSELEQMLSGTRLVGKGRHLTIESVLYREYPLDLFFHPAETSDLPRIDPA